MSEQNQIPFLSQENHEQTRLDWRKKAWRLFASMLFLVVFGLFAWPLITEQIWPPIDGLAAASDELANTPTPFHFEVVPSSPEPLPSALPTQSAQEEILAKSGQYIFLSISESGLQHLYAFDIQRLQLIRITNSEWSDEGLSIHPDGLSIAFSSNQDEHWDLQQVNLLNGDIKVINDDLAYDGNPSWSANGEWLAFERYENDNLDIFMLPIDGSLEAIRLTTDRGVDHSPAWSPRGNRIAFVSDRWGQNQIWLLNMDLEGEARLELLNPKRSEAQSDPAWSQDGQFLAWSSLLDGQWKIFVQDMFGDDSKPIEIGLGQEASWSPDEQNLIAYIVGAEKNFLISYNLNGQLIFPAIPIQGKISGLAWGAGLPNTLPAVFQTAALADSIDWHAEVELQNNASLELSYLKGVEAPFASLVSSAIPSFDALRQRASKELGWDLFANLDNSFAPLSIPPDPGYSHDWQYTGRSIEVLESFAFTEWMRVVPEEINGQLYWRVFVRPIIQNGRMGQPMTFPAWDFNERINGNNNDFQAGGKFFADVASGYWVDISAIFQDFAWQRLSALNNWRSFFPGARFNQWVFSEGLSWEQAMLQITSVEKLDLFLNH